MHVTPAVVAEERTWVRKRGDVIVPLINDVRTELGTAFHTEVDQISSQQYSDAVDSVFENGDLAVNVAALTRLLRTLDVEDDYPGFVVDELLGRELAAMIAGDQPLHLLGQATFHYADVMTHGDPDDIAGQDDLDAALAAGFQTRLPGWKWRRSPSPFGIQTNDQDASRS